ncbi:MAG: ABC transporter permease subunit [Acidobacteria bacterium]|nr:ABC transporter permease subunit [Acidobacteriota bacterium]
MNLDFWLSSGGTHVWHPDQKKPASAWEARIDELMTRQARSLDRAERQRLFADAQRIFAEEQPILYFAAPRIMVAMSRRVANVVVRAAMPLVVPPGMSFALLSAIFALVGWPPVARGVRAIVATEHRLDYAVAAESLGAGPARVLWAHLLPAARAFLAVQATLLVPAFIVAEATLSYVGFGFPDRVPSWGTMLQEASNVSAVADFPWVLAPALAMLVVVLSVNLIVQRGDTISNDASRAAPAPHPGLGAAKLRY